MTFYFYDLETSGLNPRESRIMQFAGQRTDMSLKPIGKPHNLLIKMTDDVVPDPYAVLITGITPQKTLQEGISEDEFLKLFHKEIAQPDTIFVGYNTVRFDDEFMRFILYRNLYEPYEWQYKDGRSKWDLLDVVRMMRALRPEGITWPKDKEGRATNRLELLAAANKLDHTDAHDALSDVQATIALARKIKGLQPKLFDFLLQMRDKQRVAELVNSQRPFVYTSGKYDAEFEKTTVAVLLAKHPHRGGALVYDLRHDPTQFAGLETKQLTQAWRAKRDDPGPHLPVKTLLYNRCPAVAPLGVLDESSKERLKIDMDVVRQNHSKLAGQKDFAAKVLSALEVLDKDQEAKYANEVQSAESQLYDGFIQSKDKQTMHRVHSLPPEKLLPGSVKFDDSRLSQILPLFKARNFPESLSGEEHQAWEEYRHERLLSGTPSRLARYVGQIESIQSQTPLTKAQQFILEELKLYGESIL